MGDPRPEVNSLDDMEFCLVPAGPFIMGDIIEFEKPQHEYDIEYDYWIGRYPVTVAQWRQFVEDTAKKPISPSSLRGVANHPVVDVSWYEALGLCEWLTQRWRDRGVLTPELAVTLPSEPEWEKAARGGLQIPMKPQLSHGTRYEKAVLHANSNPRRKYPWGNKIDENHANYLGTELYQTNSVGCFPSGRSPYGGEELSGNVWEWTRSLWGTFPYPEKGKERSIREDTSSSGRRVLRGGAFRYDRDLVRCAYRFRFQPDSDWGHIGFRLVVSPFNSER